ncbi:hypothetical protein [Methylocella sp.]|uniref:hypothetical protein n=1 Tax=Methylocella sp. TaxID=1978226 RepID=UPI00378417CB
MAVSESAEFWPQALAGGLGAALGVVGTVLVALVNRQPPMAALVDARIRTLIESYERHIGDLRGQIARLETRVDVLKKELDAAAKRKAPGGSAFVPPPAA